MSDLDEGFGRFASIESAFLSMLNIIADQAIGSTAGMRDDDGELVACNPAWALYTARDLQFWADKLYSYAVAIERRDALHS